MCPTPRWVWGTAAQSLQSVSHLWTVILRSDSEVLKSSTGAKWVCMGLIQASLRWNPYPTEQIKDLPSELAIYVQYCNFARSPQKLMSFWVTIFQHFFSPQGAFIQHLAVSVEGHADTQLSNKPEHPPSTNQTLQSLAPQRCCPKACAGHGGDRGDRGWTIKIHTST